MSDEQPQATVANDADKPQESPAVAVEELVAGEATPGAVQRPTNVVAPAHLLENVQANRAAPEVAAQVPVPEGTVASGDAPSSAPAAESDAKDASDSSVA